MLKIMYSLYPKADDFYPSKSRHIHVIKTKSSGCPNDFGFMKSSTLGHWTSFPNQALQKIVYSRAYNFLLEMHCANTHQAPVNHLPSTRQAPAKHSPTTCQALANHHSTVQLSPVQFNQVTRCASFESSRVEDFLCIFLYCPHFMQIFAYCLSPSHMKSFKKGTWSRLTQKHQKLSSHARSTTLSGAPPILGKSHADWTLEAQIQPWRFKSSPGNSNPVLKAQIQLKSSSRDLNPALEAQIQPWRLKA